MKKVMTLTALILTSLTFNASAAMEPKLEQKLIEICKTGLTDNLYRFNRTMMKNKINKRRIFPRLVCNGESFHEFAISNGSNHVAKKIAPFIQGTTSITDLAMNNTRSKVLPVNF
ncbi:DUF3718 domain-containing protein [Shewanella psychropiezotolerans]|uniref:DUF3718 domain-containing protein n=1 Tax=Shewanella psychropiezotolerans TaxID=2593655 RepID=A0ABX5X1B8_9GAMM|nr:MULTISPECIES: DUF3718 domain-containing protein [Shewanella]MPY21208.1 DUF3718 domain-containing protein [Shewanella sp. YLB-07]MPY21995.1 DUF3718 domain-containing protein [Shewanella sp. YLB-07]QDO85136.1 DUF3718 domain-containing protein [Shewanella psychropiezotolerans]